MKLDEIRSKIGNGHLNKAISEALKISKGTDFHDAMLALSGRFKSLDDEALMGTLSNQEVTQQKAKITSDLLRLITKMEAESISEATATESDSGSSINVSGSNYTVISGVTNSRINIGSKTPVNQEDKKKILFIYSTPDGKNALNFGKEIKKIKEALLTSESKHRDNFLFEVEEAVEAEKLFRLLNQQKADFVHIAIHGSKKKGLLFQNQHGQEYAIAADELSDTFELLSLKHRPECIILNACHSEKEALAVSKFANYTIGNKEAMPDEAAIAFTKAFYEMIFDGEDIEYAFKRAILAIKHMKMTAEDGIEIHDIPVLFKQ